MPEININIAKKPKDRPRVSEFVALCDIVSQWGAMADSFYYFIATKWFLTEGSSALTPVELSKDSAEDIASKCINRQDIDDLKLTALGEYHKKIPRREITDKGAKISVTTWPNKELCNSRRISDSTYRGQYEVYLDSVDPLLLTDSEELLDKELWLSAACENLSKLENVAYHIAHSFDAENVRILFDGECFIPYTSCWTYFSSLKNVIQDLWKIDEVWNYGYPVFREPIPLANGIDSMGIEWILPLENDKKTNHQLWYNLNEFLPYISLVTEDLVEEVIYESDYNITEVKNVINDNVGYVIRDSPYYMNRYLSDFYIEILRKASMLA